MTPLRLALLVTSIILPSVGLAAPASAVSADPTYCVERDSDYVLGYQVHPGVQRCVPGP